VDLEERAVEAEHQTVLWRDLLEDEKKGEQLELEAPSSQY